MPLLWNDTWGDYWSGDRLNTNALITEDELMSGMDIDRNSLLAPFFEIYNSSTDATAATVSKIGNNLTLTVVGGNNESTYEIPLVNGSWSDILKLINHIHQLNRGWVCNRICSERQISINLYNDSVSCLLSANKKTLNGFNGLILDDIINRVSKFIETYCNRVLVAADYTEYYDGTDSAYLKLNNYPVNSYTSLESFDYQTQTVLQTFADHTDYEFYNDEGIIYKCSEFTPGHKNYKVIYNAGYTAIPEDLKQACIEMCKLLYNKKDKTGIKSESIGNYSVTFTDDAVNGLPENVLALLNSYRRLDTQDIK